MKRGRCQMRGGESGNKIFGGGEDFCVRGYNSPYV